MTKYQDMTLAQFQELLASRASVPGGGGASALAGALGAALGAMVGNITLGNPRYRASAAALEKLVEQAQTLSQGLLEMVDRDAEAFQPLSQAYALPKDTPQRADILEDCLRQAAAVPLDILRACCQSIGLLEEFRVQGSSMVVSDAAAGGALCRGALFAAAVNIKVNTKLMKDRDWAGNIDRETDSLLAEYAPRAAALYEGCC